MTTTKHQDSAVDQTAHQTDPMGTHIVHTLLVTSQRMQRIPAALVAVLLLLLTGIVYGAWALRYTPADARPLQAALITATAVFFNWGMLWMLPVAGRSFGPDRPPALALGGLHTLLGVIAGLLGAPLWLLLSLNLALSLTAAYATWIEPFRLGVTYQRFTVAGWRDDVPPLRLLHIGDIHVERITARERRLNQLVEALRPDLIVFSGDFVNISYTDDPLTLAHIREIAGAWHAPLGVYCVSGTYTVESLERVYEFVDGLDNLRLLVDEWVQVDTPAGPLYLLGMQTTHRLPVDQEKVVRLAAQAPGAGFKLLLTHAPDVAPEADAAGYHLYLCGHTHGGQLRLPFFGAIFTGSALGRRYAMGRYDLGTVTLYTSRGVGLEGMGAPRARFLCPPEIILWEISGAGGPVDDHPVT